jgi:diguanylate cyclase (GGDEF)-like protein
MWVRQNTLFGQPVLLSAGELAPAYRWQLVRSLFTHTTLIEGCLGVAIAPAFCLVRTGWVGFAVLTVAALLVLPLRLALQHRFHRQSRNAAGVPAGSPEDWAWRFTVGGALTAGVWGLTDFCVMTRFDDPVMQLFVLAVQAGWVGGTAVRNAVSPACVAAQIWLSIGAGALFCLWAHSGVVLLNAPLLLALVKGSFGMARQNARQVMRLVLSEQRLEAANARLTELSATDGLTGIGNRRAFDATLQTEWARAAREGKQIGLLVLDVDHFKLYNDRYGHPAGDDCLRLIAALTDRTLRRPPDFAARFGGEEFVALLPGTSEAGARDVAERVRQALLEANVRHEGSPVGRVTLSIGAASLAPRLGDDPQMLIDLADQALYAAKRSGRNNVRSPGAAHFVTAEGARG